MRKTQNKINKSNLTLTCKKHFQYINSAIWHLISIHFQPQVLVEKYCKILCISPFLSKKKMWNYSFYGSGLYSGATKNFRRNLPKSPETHFMRYVLSFKNEKTVCFRRWAFKNRRNIIAFGARLFNSSLLFFKEKQIYRFNWVFFFPLHSVL